MRNKPAQQFTSLMQVNGLKCNFKQILQCFVVSLDEMWLSLC